MTPEQHYAEAESCLERADSTETQRRYKQLMAEALVHAQLACVPNAYGAYARRAHDYEQARTIPLVFGDELNDATDGSSDD